MFSRPRPLSMTIRAILMGTVLIGTFCAFVRHRHHVFHSRVRTAEEVGCRLRYKDGYTLSGACADLPIERPCDTNDFVDYARAKWRWIMRDVSDVAGIACRNKEFSDDQVRLLLTFPHVREIDLSGTRITDRGVLALASLSELEYIGLARTGVSEEAFHQMQEIRPGIKTDRHFDWEVSDKVIRSPDVFDSRFIIQ